jgi:hypothetical protein
MNSVFGLLPPVFNMEFGRQEAGGRMQNIIIENSHEKDHRMRSEFQRGSKRGHD